MSDDDKGTHDAAEKARGLKAAETQLIHPKKQSFFGSLWSSFLAGVVVAAPIGITVALVYWFVTGPMARLDAVVKRTLPYGGSEIESILQVLPGVGVLAAFIALVLLGAFAKNFIGRSFIRAGERLVESVPVVRNLYSFFKNVFETALRQSERSFKEVALIQYPRPGAWAIAFVIGDAKGEISALLKDQGEELTALFVPTVPNPTSGFLLFVPRADMRVLKMSVEEAAKAVLSLGLVIPEYNDPNDPVKALEKAAAEVDREPLRNKIFRLNKKTKN